MISRPCCKTPANTLVWRSMSGRVFSCTFNVMLKAISGLQGGDCFLVKSLKALLNRASSVGIVLYTLKR